MVILRSPITQQQAHRIRACVFADTIFHIDETRYSPCATNTNAQQFRFVLNLPWNRRMWILVNVAQQFHTHFNEQNGPVQNEWGIGECSFQRNSREWNSIIGKLNSKICAPSEKCKLNYANVVESSFFTSQHEINEIGERNWNPQTLPAHGNSNAELEKLRITFVIMLNEWNRKIPNPNAESVLGNVKWNNSGA